MSGQNKLENHDRKTETPYDRLCAAVIEQSIKDYYTALKRLQITPNNKTAQWTVDECELFFRKDMEIYSDMDGEWIMKEIKRRVKGEDGDIDTLNNYYFDD